jgi:hypothetical protein
VAVFRPKNSVCYTHPAQSDKTGVRTGSRGAKNKIAAHFDTSAAQTGSFEEKIGTNVPGTDKNAAPTVDGSGRS